MSDENKIETPEVEVDNVESTEADGQVDNVETPEAEKAPEKDETLIGRVHAKDYNGLKDDLESVVAKKIHDRIQSTKNAMFGQPKKDS